MKPIGLYIHIPFCIKKCDYCDFLSFKGNKILIENYINSLIDEIKSYNYLNDNFYLKTIYFGGGTPSSIDAKYISKILDTIYNIFDTSNLCENTLEANPCTISSNKINIYKNSGINRLSIGLQSANNKELILLGRSHTYEQFEKSYFIAREAGFKNISIDLISGLPYQTVEQFLNSLNIVINLNPEHISIYSLIIEENTPFFNRYKDNKCIDEEIDREIYHQTKSILSKYNYNRYEISNYSKFGFEAIHNMSYWDRTDYIGLGLGASSLLNNTRFHNCYNINKYIENAKKNIFEKCDIEILSTQHQMEEFMFLGLRKTKGININEFQKYFNINIFDVYNNSLKKMFNQNLIIQDEDFIKLSDFGTDICNYVFEQFLF